MSLVHFAFLSAENKEQETQLKIEQVFIRLYLEALKKQEEGKYFEAIKLYKKLLSYEVIYDAKEDKKRTLKENTYLYLKYLGYKNISESYCVMNDYESSMPFFTNAVNVNGSDISYLFLFAEVALKCQHYNVSVRILERLLSQAPRHNVARKIYIQSLFYVGEHKKCSDFAKEYIKENPRCKELKEIIKKINNQEFFNGYESDGDVMFQDKPDNLNEINDDDDDIKTEGSKIELFVEGDFTWENLLIGSMQCYFSTYNHNSVIKIIRREKKKKEEALDEVMSIDMSVFEFIDVDEEQGGVKRKRLGKEDGKSKKAKTEQKQFMINYIRNYFIEEEPKEISEEAIDLTIDSQEKVQEIGTPEKRRLTKELGEKEEEILNSFDFLKDEGIEKFIETQEENCPIVLIQFIKSLLESIINQTSHSYRYTDNLKNCLVKTCVLLVENHDVRFIPSHEQALAELLIDFYFMSNEEVRDGRFQQQIFSTAKKFLGRYESFLYNNNDEIKIQDNNFLIRRYFLQGLLFELSNPIKGLKTFEKALDLMQKESTVEKKVIIFLPNFQPCFKISMEYVSNKIKQLEVAHQFFQIDEYMEKKEFTKCMQCLVGLIKANLSKTLQKRLRKKLIETIVLCNDYTHSIFQIHSVDIVYEILNDFNINEIDPIGEIACFLENLYIYSSRVSLEKSYNNYTKRKFIVNKLKMLIEKIELFSVQTYYTSRCLSLLFMILFRVGTIQHRLEKYIHLQNIRIYLTTHRSVVIDNYQLFFNFLIHQYYKVYMSYRNEGKDVGENIDESGITMSQMKKELFLLYYLVYDIVLFNAKAAMYKEIFDMNKIPGRKLKFDKNNIEITCIAYILLHPLAEKILKKVKKKYIVRRLEMRNTLARFIKVLSKIPRDLVEARRKIYMLQDQNFYRQPTILPAAQIPNTAMDIDDDDDDNDELILKKKHVNLVNMPATYGIVEDEDFPELFKKEHVEKMDLLHLTLKLCLPLFSKYNQLYVENKSSDGIHKVKSFTFSVLLLNKCLSFGKGIIQYRNWLTLSQHYIKIIESYCNALDSMNLRKEIVQGDTRKYLCLNELLVQYGVNNLNTPTLWNIVDDDICVLINRCLNCLKYAYKLIREEIAEINEKLKKAQGKYIPILKRERTFLTKRFNFCRFEICRTFFRSLNFLNFKKNRINEYQTVIRDANQQRIYVKNHQDLVVRNFQFLMKNTNLDDKRWQDHYLEGRFKEHVFFLISHPNSLNREKLCFELVNSYYESFVLSEQEVIETQDNDGLIHCGECLFKFLNIQLQLMLTKEYNLLKKIRKNYPLKLKMKVGHADSTSMYFKVNYAVKDIKKVPMLMPGVTTTTSIGVYRDFLNCLKLYTQNFKAVVAISQLIGGGPWMNWKLSQDILLSVLIPKEKVQGKKVAVKPFYYELDLYDDAEKQFPVNGKLELRSWIKLIFKNFFKIIQVTKDTKCLSGLIMTMRYEEYSKKYSWGIKLYEEAVKNYYELLRGVVKKKEDIQSVLECCLYALDSNITNQVLLAQINKMKEEVILSNSINLKKTGFKAINQYCRATFKTDYKQRDKKKRKKKQKSMNSFAQ